jgi:hypothetical protein
VGGGENSGHSVPLFRHALEANASGHHFSGVSIFPRVQRSPNSNQERQFKVKGGGQECPAPHTTPCT